MPIAHLALAIVSGIAAQSGAKSLDEALRQSIAAQGPIVSKADKAAIAAKCGLSSGAASDNIRFEDGALHCPNGRIVKNAKTREMSHRIATRAKAHVSKAMSDPSVKTAITRFADEKTREALRRVASDARR